jgi:hypothetical protein
MRRYLFPAIGLLAVASSLIAAASAAGSLPQQAILQGAVAGGGSLVFRVHDREVVLMRGKLPARAGDRCLLANTGKISFRIPNRDPIQNGHFGIFATQVLVRIHGGIRRTRLWVNGQFDATGYHATGTMRLVITDPGGRCATPNLSWRIPA